ncbi:ABC transporter permease [Stygiobacter electus]|uniref:ABC transporter permease n=1 Tax=Stygiobacter electus TaxID=3032292 RepID=A0AAE3NWD3_9BACT|nr:ABC transporter permease [Stygiobacter electus]MDF1612146.1 ABC transporter permease [Stygiobacter electus]
MKIFEVIKVAFASLQANKLRSLLTILGIVVGIFSIIAISTVIEMLQLSIEKGVSQLGQNTFQIQKWPAVNDGGNNRARFRNRPDITLEDYYALKEKLVEAKYIGAEQWNFGKQLKVGNRETNPNVPVAGVTPEAFPNNKWTVEEGRAISERDVQSYQNFIVLGPDVAKKLFPNISPLNQIVNLDGHKLKVIGILEVQGDVFGQSRDNFAIVPLTYFQSMYGKRNNSINITVMSHDKESYNELIEIAEGYFRTIRKVAPGEPNNFDIFSNESVLTQINDITAGVRIGSLVVAAIALLAAGVGIMNIMLVSVTERTREIGIRKAIGARKKNILVQFLTESVVLSLFGGIVGIVLGILVGNLAGSFLKADTIIPIDWVLIGVFLCVIIGVTFGTYPAYKASNLDPIEALRYE